MSDINLIILFLALIIDWRFGEPDFLWSRLPHPIVLFGKAVSFADKKLNQTHISDSQKYRNGAFAISVLIFIALIFALGLQYLIHQLGWIGFAIELFVVFVLLAQKSLYDHVKAVSIALREHGIQGGRDAVAMIVGRDPSKLDQSGVSRAAIESLAENFSDGVVAPAFWYAVFGLPGLIVYKMINTADSMIAYKNDKYLWFGRVAAQIDDLANWLPARLSAFLISVAILYARGFKSAKASLKTAFQDSGLHASPNAGWPEGAMAGGLGVALGGSRVYEHEIVQQAWLNANGKIDLTAQDIDHSLSVFAFSCYALWAVVIALFLM